MLRMSLVSLHWGKEEWGWGCLHFFVLHVFVYSVSVMMQSIFCTCLHRILVNVLCTCVKQKLEYVIRLFISCCISCCGWKTSNCISPQIFCFLLWMTAVSERIQQLSRSAYTRSTTSNEQNVDVHNLSLRSEIRICNQELELCKHFAHGKHIFRKRTLECLFLS